MPIGEILLIPNEGVVGVADTWPFAVTLKHGALHAVRDWESPHLSKFAQAIATARELAAHPAYTH